MAAPPYNDLKKIANRHVQEALQPLEQHWDFQESVVGLSKKFAKGKVGMIDSSSVHAPDGGQQGRGR